MDYYLKNRDRLLGQPKCTIADYVASHDILVPQRFDTFDDAMRAIRQGVSVIARSEHPQDYDGCSGLLNSVVFSDGCENEATLRDLVLDKAGRVKMHEQHCELQGKDVDEFERDVTISYWEHIGGMNRTIVADSAVSERWHIMGTMRLEQSTLQSYRIVEGNKHTYTTGSEFGMEHDTGLIEMYEHVRTLPHFDSNHCPIIEAQTVGNAHFFLQYHRGCDFLEPTFTLPPNYSDGQKALFVRGATPPEGITCDVVFVASGDFNGNFNVHASEMGAIECNQVTHRGAYIELMVRHRELQFIHSKKDGLDALLRDAHSRHGNVSQFFKPRVSLVLHNNPYTAAEKNDAMDRVMSGSEKNESIRMHVVSDGRNAYAKRA